MTSNVFLGSNQTCHNNDFVYVLWLQFTTGAILEHINNLLQIPGSKLLFGGEPLENHSIPTVYGAIKPTAVYVPLEEIVKDNNYDLVTKEIFGPFQVKTDKTDRVIVLLN